LTKGLIGVVLPALILIGFVVVRGDWRLLLEARLQWGIPIFLLIVSPWFVLVDQATDGKWLRDFILIHHIKRYTAGAGHREPFYYYFTSLPVDFLPWTIFAVPALVAYRVRRKFFQEATSLFFILWFIAVFVFFTLSDTKRELYLLPLFPPMALFVAHYIDGLINGRSPQGKLYRGVLLGWFNLLWIGCLAAPIAAWFVRRDAFLAILPYALAMACGSLLTAYFAWRQRPWQTFLATTLTMLAGVLAASLWFLPFLERFKSPRPFSAEVKKIVSPTMPLYIYADSMNDFNFYTERDVIPVIASPSGLKALLARDQAGYLLIKARDMERTGGIARERILVSEGGGGRSWYLIALGARFSPLDG
jgi:4-amino-4-deoxy-L-arabinose transferase-like glycosyltransferase